MRQIKDMEQELKKQYKVVKYLCEQSGFGWDNERNMVTAPDEEVWQPILETNANARRWFKQPFPYYIALQGLYEGKFANGKRSRAGVIIPPALQSLGPSNHVNEDSNMQFEWEDDVGEFVLRGTNPIHVAHAPRDIEDGNEAPQPQSSRSPEPPRETTIPRQGSFSQVSKHCPHKRFKGSKKSSFNFGEEYLAFRKEESQRFFTLEKEKVQPSEDHNSITKCINIFNEMQGFGEEDLFDASLLFFEKNCREIFLALKDEQIIGWIKRMIDYRKRRET